MSDLIRNLEWHQITCCSSHEEKVKWF